MKRKATVKGLCFLFGLFFSCALLLYSCTHRQSHPMKTDKERSADHEACEKWAREGIRDEPDTYDNMDEMKMIKHCMKQKGWTWERTGFYDFNKDK